MFSKTPKEFQKTSEVLPFTKYGLSTVDEFRKVETDIQHLEYLKKIGLSNDEIKLYQENEAGILDQRKKIESTILKTKLKSLYNKINHSQNVAESSQQSAITAHNTSAAQKNATVSKVHMQSTKLYAEGHPINELKEIEEDLFGHFNNDIIPIAKRRKMLRRLERKKEKLILLKKDPGIDPISGPSQPKPGSLWDVKNISEIPKKVRHTQSNNFIGPKQQTMYTIKDDRIVRLEPVQNQEDDRQEFRAVDIVMPVNAAEEQLLEGTKMCLDDIRKIDRFKDYVPGIPSKVLFLKNISPSVDVGQLSLVFQQFQLENGGPVELRLMAGRMRGQAFVTFTNEDLAIQALEEVNGTILGGRPVIAQFGRNSNRIQVEENR